MDRLPPKYAAVEEILEVKTSHNRLDLVPSEPGQNLAKFAATQSAGPIQNGYLYIRARAISSRVNKNNDGWPSEELANAYKTFIGRPAFVDHNNSDPKRARGVIVDAKLHVEDEKTSSRLDPYYAKAPDNHKPPTWIETLTEVDAETYPKLAKALLNGDIDAVSMGANIQRSVCSVCGNEATVPTQYCSHVNNKGVEFEVESSNGEKVRKLAYEDCYGVNFFEQSFVFDPADTTADAAPVAPTEKLASIKWAEVDLDSGESRELNYEPQSEETTAPQKVDTLQDDIKCPNCEADVLTADPDGILRCATCGYEQPPEGLDNPDLAQAQEIDKKRQLSPEQNDKGEEIIRADDSDAEDVVEKPIYEPYPSRPTKSHVTTKGIDEMKWKKVLATDNLEDVGELFEKTAATVQVPIGYGGGYHIGTIQALRRLGLTDGTITYPDGRTIPLDANPMMHMATQALIKKSTGVPPAEQLVTIEAPDEDIDRIVQVMHAGGDIGGKPMASTKESDRRVIKREELPHGRPTQQIVEETGDLDFDNVEEEEPEEPKAEEEPDEESEEESSKQEESQKREPVAASVDNQVLLKAMQVAEQAVEMGVIPKDRKMAFIGQLEDDGMERIEAKREILNLVKSAGLRRSVRSVTKGLPKMGEGLTRQASNGHGSLDDIPFEAIFYNG